MAKAALLVLALVVALAGCAAPPPGGDGGKPPTSPTLGGPGASDWPMYGRDLANSRHNTDEKAFDASRLKDFREAWRFFAGGAITGTPAVVDGRVYVGSWAGKFHALDAATGRVLWNATVGARVDSSAAVDDGVVYFGDSNGTLHARDAATGAAKWSVRSDVYNSTHLWGSPVVVGDLVITGVASDQESWRHKGPLDFRGSVAAFRVADGSLAWRHVLAESGEAGSPVWSTPAVDLATKRLFFGTGNAYREPAGATTDALVALSLEDGSRVWLRQMTKNDVFTQTNPISPDWDFGASANLFRVGDRLVMGEGQKSSVYHVLDAATGDIVWQHGEAVSGDGIVGSTAAAGGRIVVPYAAKQRVAALAMADGREVWTRPLDGAVFAPPAVAGGVVVVGSTGGTLHALSLATGESLAAKALGVGPIYGGASLASG
ncbi:MAG TPA: PQQ-binding-like beta-propeller repeat protein, partial [Candidatus Thermoplasmatota archaeon]|nr:PQQ-binding-like beta-propeller repeat protein [Candidatus Thermoplasmatota archaeon]